MDYNYALIIRVMYDLADSQQEQYFRLVSGPPIDDPLGEFKTRIVSWNLPAPQPSIAELEAYAQTPAYWERLGSRLKTQAEIQVNAWANEKVMTLKILEPELFYVAMVANVAFRLLDWNMSGRPESLDVSRFLVTHSEAQAYREAHAGKGTAEESITALDLLRIQEGRWLQMQQVFASVVFERRLALEKIKLATVGEGLEAELDAILDGLQLAQSDNGA